MKLRKMDLKEKTNPMSKKSIIDKVHEKARAEGKNAKAQDIFDSFGNDNIEIRDELRSLCDSGSIFLYKGEFYPWRDIKDMYKEIATDIQALIEEWYKIRDEPLDAVHILDYPDDLEYYPQDGKLNISWKALVWVCKEMERRGEVSTV
jgi:hypothetical protein